MNQNEQKKGESISPSLEIKISQILRVGVSNVGLFLAVGLLWTLSRDKIDLSDYQYFDRVSLSESVQWAMFFDQKGLLLCYLGLVILVCLPLLRVLLTSFLFIRNKEYVLGLIALAVFSALVGSFLLGYET